MNSPIDDASNHRIWTICLITLTALASTYTVYWLRPVLVPLVVAVFVVSGVSPILVTLERRLGVNRLIAAVLTFLAGVVLLGLFGFSIWVSIVDLAENSEAYGRRVRELVTQIEERFPIELTPPDRNIAASDNADGSNNPDDRRGNDGASTTGASNNERDSESDADGNNPDERADPDASEVANEGRNTDEGSKPNEGDKSGEVDDPVERDNNASINTSERQAESNNAADQQDADDQSELNVPAETKDNSIGNDTDPGRPPTLADAGNDIGNDVGTNAGSTLAERELVPFGSDPGNGSVEDPTAPGQYNSEFIDSIVRQGISVVSQSLISMVSTSVVVLIYVFFLLIGTPTGHHSETFREVDLQIRSYLALKTIISIFTGGAFGLALQLFGVPMSFTFGVMAFLLNFVPNVGPLVASLLPIPLIVLDPSGSVLWMVTTITVIWTIQLVSGNFVEPKIMGDSSDLHPVTILLALMFWGMMWGVIGMFLATPITAAMKIVLERIDQTRPIAGWMAGRWTIDE